MISAIVLAAGKSARMGANKLLLPFKGKTIIEHTVDALLRSKARDVIVVLGHEADKVRRVLGGRSVLFVENLRYDEGMSGSIQAGLRRVAPLTKGILVSLGDQPLVDAQEIDLLIGAFLQTKKKIIVPTYKGRRGNPVILDMSYKDEILRLSGDIGGRELLKQHANEVCAVEMTTDHVLHDIDEPADYKSLQADNTDLTV